MPAPRVRSAKTQSAAAHISAPWVGVVSARQVPAPVLAPGRRAATTVSANCSAGSGGGGARGSTPAVGGGAAQGSAPAGGGGEGTRGSTPPVVKKAREAPRQPGAVEEPHEGLLQPGAVEESHKDMEVPVPAEPACKPEVGVRARPASPPEAGAPRGPARRMRTWLPVSHAAPMPRRYCLPRGRPMDQLRCHRWRSGCCSRSYVHSATVCK